MSKITIITVAYNAVDHIESTILSVIPFLSDRVEYIIIDGGSMDGTVRLINHYDKHLKCWISEPDSGIYDAMNKGWNLADDDSSILFLGAGDRLIGLPSADYPDSIVYGKVLIGDQGLIFSSRLTKELMVGNTLHHQALLIPKKVSLSSPFNLAYKIYADFDFNQRLYKAGKHFVYSPEFVGYALPGGVSEKFHTREMLGIVYSNYGLIKAIHSFLSINYYLISRKLSSFNLLRNDNL